MRLLRSRLSIVLAALLSGSVIDPLIVEAAPAAISESHATVETAIPSRAAVSDEDEARDIARYTLSEQRTTAPKQFSGGAAVIVIGSTAAVAILVVVALLLLL